METKTTCWEVDALVLKEYLTGREKELTEAGLFHIWIVQHNKSQILTTQGSASPAHHTTISSGRMVPIPKELAAYVKSGGGIYDAENPVKTKRRDKARMIRTPLTPGTTLNVDLMVGGFKVVGTVTVVTVV